MATSIGSTAALRLLTDGAAKSSKAEDATQRISAIVNKMTVAASPAAKQVAALAASLAYAQPVKASPPEAQTTVRMTETAAATAEVAPTTASWQAEGAPQIGNSFASMIGAKMMYQDSIAMYEQVASSLKANSTDRLAQGRTTEQIADADRQIDAFVANLKEGGTHLANMARKWESWVRTNYSVTGTMFSHTSDGKLQWGTFEVRNQATGQFFFGHDGSGLGKERDGVSAQFQEYKLT